MFIKKAEMGGREGEVTITLAINGTLPPSPPSQRHCRVFPPLCSVSYRTVIFLSPFSSTYGSRFHDLLAVVPFSLLPDSGQLSIFLSSFRFRTDRSTVSRDLHASGSCMFESGKRLGTSYNISLKISVIANGHSSQLLCGAMNFCKHA